MQVHSMIEELKRRLDEDGGTTTKPRRLSPAMRAAAILAYQQHRDEFFQLGEEAVTFLQELADRLTEDDYATDTPSIARYHRLIEKSRELMQDCRPSQTPEQHIAMLCKTIDGLIEELSDDEVKERSRPMLTQLHHKLQIS